MDSDEEHHINRLLWSVEREERDSNGRPQSNDIVRNLFADESENEENEDSEDDDGVGILQEIREDHPDLQHPDDEEEDVIDDNDFDDIEAIPLHLRLQKNLVVTRINGKEAYLSKDGKTLWDVQPTIQRQARARKVIRVRVSNVNPAARNFKTPLEVFKLFFTDAMIEDIVTNTNIYINNNKDRYTHERHCKPTNVTEIKALIGLLYMLGVMKMSHINLEDAWSRDGLGIEFFPLVMSLYRFKFLLRAIRFNDLNTREDRKRIDRLAPIRDMFEDFVQNCQTHYNVSAFVTVDEMLEAFRGHCGFRMYIKSKPARYGVKIFAMCYARSYYTCSLEVYAGKQPEGPFKIDNSAKSVVERMIEPISGSSRNVTVDNWISSIPLCEDLIKNHNLTLVGTLRKNKREIPPSFVDLKHLPVGGSQFGFKKRCTMVAYKAKKNQQVVLLSSMHDDDAIDNDENSRTHGKPEIILFYNSTKGGVDTVDKLKEQYSVSRTSNWWSLTVFYSLLNIAGVNSFIVLKENIGEPRMKRRRFLKALANDLCKDQMLSRVPIKSTPSRIKRRVREIFELPNEGRPPPADDVTSGRCYACTWRQNRSSKTRCADCKFFICKEHAAPARCVNCVQGNDEEMDSE